MRECSQGDDFKNNSNVNEAQEICAEYNVRYVGAGVTEVMNGVIDAEVCRAKCIQDGRCKFWTWGEDRECNLIR